MTLRGVVLVGAVGVAFSFAAACGSDEDSPQNPGVSDADGGPSTGTHGIDVRPSNTTCLAGQRPSSSTSIKLTRVFANLSFHLPIGLVQAKNDASKWYVVEQGETIAAAGKIRAFANDDDVTFATDVYTVPATEISTEDDGGMAAFALHPDFATNGTAFVSYTVRSATSPVDMKSVVMRVKKKADSDEFDRTTEEILYASDGRKMTFDQPTRDHHNADMAFGPDGMLYIAFGDGGEKTGVKGQDLSTFFAKIIRIDVGPTGPYAIPANNPFAGDGTKLQETWAYGFRNPWKFSFDRQTGELWTGDVGEDLYEEVDLIQKGGNYGWAVMEAKHCKGASNCDATGMLPPVVEYTHTNGNHAVVGGFVYRGTKIPGLVGSYLFADYVSGRIWRVVRDGSGIPAMDELVVSGFPISSFGEGADGEVYVVDIAGGRIFRIDPDLVPGPGRDFPQVLSATGCVNPKNPQEPSPAMIPYDVNSALWSDGAEKHRWMAVPDGKRILVGPDGDFDYPNGSVLMKEFRLDGKLVETRLLARHDDGVWAGYSYEWNDEGTEAFLLTGMKVKTIGIQDWTFPSGKDCLACHTEAAGRSLGLDVGQLNGDFLYPATQRTENQLSALDHVGMFETPIGDPATLTRYPRLTSTDPLELRARAYLHANCSHCHRRGGGTPAEMDLRFDRSFAQTDTCNVESVVDDLGIENSRLIVPGDTAKSLISARMHSVTASRMPPLARILVDQTGVDVIDGWISSLQTCPQ